MATNNEEVFPIDMISNESDNESDFGDVLECENDIEGHDPLDKVQEENDVELHESEDGEDENFLLSILSFMELENMDFLWEKKEKLQCISAFEPDTDTGPTRKVPPGDTAVTYFNLFFDEKILVDVCKFTNTNAKDKIARDKENGKSEEWGDITVVELKAFIGVLILIELLYKDRIESLWSSSERWPLLNMPGLTKVFPRDRYMQIARYLHFNSEAGVPNVGTADYDKLYKIRPLLDHLRKKFQEEYTPEQEMSIDECMVPFRGRLSFKQYCKDKPVKFDVKVFMLAESKSGYNCNFEVYTGRESFVKMGLCSRIVITLSKPLFDKGYHIYTDRFYTSPTLLHYLSLVGLRGCGTVLPNKKHFPRELIRATTEMNRGEYDWLMCQNTGVVATVWCDRKPIYFLSNIHIPDYDITVKRKDCRGREVNVDATPSVFENNRHMGGVDLNDRMACIDKSRKQYKWYWRLFRKSIRGHCTMHLLLRGILLTMVERRVGNVISDHLLLT